jgi:hypothetical protein
MQGIDADASRVPESRIATPFMVIAAGAYLAPENSASNVG